MTATAVDFEECSLEQIVGLTGGAGDAKEIAMKARRSTSKDLLEGVAISFRVAGHDLLVSHAQPLATPELTARYGTGRNRGLRTEPRASPWDQPARARMLRG